MFYGFLITGVCLAALVLLCVHEIRRVDRIIEKVDRDIGQPDQPRDQQ